MGVAIGYRAIENAFVVAHSALLFRNAAFGTPPP